MWRFFLETSGPNQHRHGEIHIYRERGLKDGDLLAEVNDVGKFPGTFPMELASAETNYVGILPGTFRRNPNKQQGIKSKT